MIQFVYTSGHAASFVDNPEAALHEVAVPDGSALKFVHMDGIEEPWLFAPLYPRQNTGLTAADVLRYAQTREHGFRVVRTINKEDRRVIERVAAQRKAGATLPEIGAKAGRSSGWASYWLDRGEGRR